MRKRDLGILLLAAFAIFFSLQVFLLPPSSFRLFSIPILLFLLLLGLCHVFANRADGLIDVEFLPVLNSLSLLHFFFL